MLQEFHAQSLQDTPFAVIDTETTGLSPGWDRVVEVSVITLHGGKAEVTFNSLVNPEQSVGPTHVHGITNADVANAPRFSEIARDLAADLVGKVLVGHNFYFDMRFLKFEFGQLDFAFDVPFICSKSMCSGLGLGKNQKLGAACRDMGITIENAHAAYDDALACALLFQHYLEFLSQKQVLRIGDLKKVGKYKYLDSFRNLPVAAADFSHLTPSREQKPRAGSPRAVPPMAAV